MKRTFKKIVTAILAVAVLSTSVLTLASCGKDYTANNTAFVIGGSGPLTGDNASYGISVQNGAQLAVDQLNKGDMKFKLIMKDDEAAPENAKLNYNILYESGMQVSLGGVTSGAAEQFAKLADQDRVFTMTPSASADNVIKDMTASFRLCFGDPDQGYLAAEFIKEGGYKNIGAIYNVSDSYSSGIYQAFKSKMAELGLTYIEKTFDEENSTDFTTQAEALKDCDIIFMPFYYTEASLFAKAIVMKNSDAVLFGCDGFDGIKDLIDGVDNKIMYITPFDINSDDQQTKDFVAAYRAKYNMDPDQFAADAYDVVMVLAKALKEAGITDYTISPSEICELLIDKVTSEGFSYDGLTGKMTWDKSGACSKEPNIVELN